MIKKLIAIFTLVTMLTLGCSFNSFASVNDLNKNTKVHKFTDEAQAQCNLIHKLVSKGSIVIVDGLYNIVSDTPGVMELSKENLDILNHFLSVFNQGISMGLFKINPNNYL